MVAAGTWLVHDFQQAFEGCTCRFLRAADTATDIIEASLQETEVELAECCA